MLAYKPPNRHTHILKTTPRSSRDINAFDNIHGQACRKACRLYAQSELRNNDMISAIASNASYFGTATFRGNLKSKPGMNAYPDLVHVRNVVHPSSGTTLAYYRSEEGRLFYFTLETTDDCKRLVRDGRTCSSRTIDEGICSIDKNHKIYTNTCDAMLSRCETSNEERIVKESSIFCNAKLPPVIIKYVNFPYTWIYVFPTNGDYAQVYVLD